MWSPGSLVTGSAIAAEVARAQNTVIVVPAAIVPVVCAPFGTATNALGVASVTASVPADSQKRSPMSFAWCAGHDGDTAPTPVSEAPFAWKVGGNGAALWLVIVLAARNAI